MVPNLSLTPKYQLDGAAIQGARTTIPAEPFTYLTTRVYPYPRTGTRAPDGMFPQQRVGEAYAPGLYTTRIPGVRRGQELRPKAGNPHRLLPKYQSYGPAAWVRAPTLKSNPGMKAHFTLDKAVVQGVMPASTYQQLTGKITTEPGLPQVVTEQARTIERYPRTSLMFEPPQQRLVRAPVGAPALQWDWSTFFWGSLAGGATALLLAYGVIPALLEFGARRIRR